MQTKMVSIILTKAGDHLPGQYTFRTSDQRLIGKIFPATSRSEFETALAEFRRDLGYAPINVETSTQLDADCAAFIAKQPA